MTAHKTPSGVRYWTYGDKTKPCLLFVHGFTGSHDGFQYIVPLLERDFHIIVPDLPGFGVSKPAKKPWTIQHVARQTNAFVASLALTEKPCLVSHSMGGLVAAHMLAQKPELFAQKTVFISPVATRVSWLDPRKPGELAGRAQYGAGRHVRKIAESKLAAQIATKAIITTKNKSLKQRIYEHHFDNLRYVSSADYYYQLHKDINRQGVIELADSLRPFDTLIIASDKDNVTPLKSVRTLGEALDAQLHVISGVGHLAHYEKPGAIASALASFLR